jgi:hypothetical protein
MQSCEWPLRNLDPWVSTAWTCTSNGWTATPNGDDCASNDQTCTPSGDNSTLTGDNCDSNGWKGSSKGGNGTLNSDNFSSNGSNVVLNRDNWDVEIKRQASRKTACRVEESEVAGADNVFPLVTQSGGMGNERNKARNSVAARR